MAERTRRPGELPPLPQPIVALDSSDAAPAPSAGPNGGGNGNGAATAKADAKPEAKPEAKPDPIIGTVIGDRYRIVERIGSGGMAIVYRAEHESLRKSMAVKLLLPEMAVDADMVARFEREAVAAARLDHPNCVAITDFGRTRQGRLFLVMEYIDGQALSDVSGYGKRLHWERAVEIARQVLRGLARAHETGIVHRDLKASNIMLVSKEGGREIAKIIDFGIAKMFDGTATTGIPSVQTQAGVVFGTADFLAPERLVGKGDMDPRSDIYSVGIILYEMVTGTRPFHDDDPYVIVKRALAETPKPPREMTPDADIPEALEAIILKALEKPVEDRYATARDFLNALDPLGKRAQSTSGYLAGDAPTHAAAAAPTMVSNPQRRRASWGMWVALVVFPIALISLGIVLAVQSNEDDGGASPTSKAPFPGKDTKAKPSGAAMTDADVARLVKEAAEGDTVEERQRAFDRLEALGYVDRVPWVEKLSKDLEQLPTCPERRDIVTQLKKLKDRKALPALQKAGARADNDCLKDQAQKAIASLGGEEPAPAGTTSTKPPAPPRKRPPPKKSGGGGHF